MPNELSKKYNNFYDDIYLKIKYIHLKIDILNNCK